MKSRLQSTGSPLTICAPTTPHPTPRSRPNQVAITSRSHPITSRPRAKTFHYHTASVRYITVLSRMPVTARLGSPTCHPSRRLGRTGGGGGDERRQGETDRGQEVTRGQGETRQRDRARRGGRGETGRRKGEDRTTRQEETGGDRAKRQEETSEKPRPCTAETYPRRLRGGHIHAESGGGTSESCQDVGRRVRFPAPGPDKKMGQPGRQEEGAARPTDVSVNKCTDSGNRGSALVPVETSESRHPSRDYPSRDSESRHPSRDIRRGLRPVHRLGVRRWPRPALDVHADTPDSAHACTGRRAKPTPGPFAKKRLPCETVSTAP